MAGKLMPLLPKVNMDNKPVFVPALALCVLLDAVGMMTYLIPALGEFGDIVWAPISGFLFYRLFGGRFGLVGGVLNFLEEVLPFTDIIPSFTIAWFIRKNEAEKLKVLHRQIK